MIKNKYSAPCNACNAWVLPGHGKAIRYQRWLVFCNSCASREASKIITF